MRELGINATAPTDFIERAKGIVCSHNDLQKKRGGLEAEIRRLEGEQEQLIARKEKEILEVKNSSSALEAQLEEVQGKLSEKERELAAVQAESSSMSAAGAELDQYKAALQEWSLWAEARTSEIAALQQERDLLLQLPF